MLPFAHLSTDSDTPIYKQLSDQIRNQIKTGQLVSGQKLPATRELAGQLGLNRATVSAAYQVLESEGYIKGHVGKGSFVQPVADPDSPAANWQKGFLPNEANFPEPAPHVAISFASSRPSADLFPLDQFREVCEAVIDSPELPSILQLGSPYGYEPLRRWLLNQAIREGAAKPGDEIVVTNGCQQALDILARTLIQPGDAILVEDPVYAGLRQPFSRAGARLIAAPVGPHGCRLDKVEPLLARERPRLLLVTPSFQNPTGATLPLQARRELIRMAASAGTLVVENGIYAGLRYEGELLPPLKQLDQSAGTIQLGSFSKIAFPGLRVGWVLAPRAIAAALADTKQWSDLHSDHLSQAVLLRFAESGLLDEHKRRMIEAGRRRLAACLDACQEFLPEGSRFTRPQGGMNLWVELPGRLDTADLLRRAESEGVSYLPGRFFSLSGGAPGSLRLSFPGLEPDKIRRGVSILGKLFQQHLALTGRARDSQPAMALV